MNQLSIPEEVTTLPRRRRRWLRGFDDDRPPGAISHHSRHASMSQNSRLVWIATFAVAPVVMCYVVTWPTAAGIAVNAARMPSELL